MGAAHAGNCPEIHKSGFSLPSSHHQGAGRKGKTAIPECLACDEQAVAKIGRMVECPIKLTFYVARHGWASIAKSQNVPVPVISEALGHDSEDTTRIYLALLDSSVVDKANSKVIRSIGR